MAARIVGPDDFLEIFVSTPLAECEKRDVKGLYAKARRDVYKRQVLCLYKHGLLSPVACYATGRIVRVPVIHIVTPVSYTHLVIGMQRPWRWLLYQKSGNVLMYW